LPNLSSKSFLFIEHFRDGEGERGKGEEEGEGEGEGNRDGDVFP